MPAEISAPIDPAIEEEAAAVLAGLGVTVSDAVRLMLTRVACEKALPFEPFRPTDVTAAAMEEARSRALPRFATVAGLMAGLDADD